MSVEISPPPSSAKPAASNEASGTKGKPRSGTDSKTGGSDAFSSLMMALGEADSSSIAPDGLQTKAEKDELITKESASSNNSVGAMLAQDSAPKELAALLAQDANPKDPNLLAGQPLPLVQTSPKAKLGVDKTDAVLNGLTGTSLNGLALNVGDGVDGQDLSLADQAKRAIKGVASSKSLTQAGSDNALQLMSSTLGKEVRDLKADLKTVLQADANSFGRLMPEMLAASVFGDKDKHPAETLVDKFSVKSMSPGGEGALGQQGLSPTQRVDAPSASDSATAYTPEMQVAEKVNYWISSR